MYEYYPCPSLAFLTYLYSIRYLLFDLYVCALYSMLSQCQILITGNSDNKQNRLQEKTITIIIMAAKLFFLWVFKIQLCCVLILWHFSFCFALFFCQIKTTKKKYIIIISRETIEKSYIGVTSVTNTTPHYFFSLYFICINFQM